MSYLLVDAGNSRIKWRARSDDGQYLDGAGPMGDGGLFGSLSGHPIDAIAVSTVISEAARETLSRKLRDQFGVAPAFYWPRVSECGVRCAYARPETMGADRWHAMIGAWQAAREPLMVVDAGSALTIDLVDAGGGHLGGFILPGQRLMRESLEDKTARVSFGDALSLDTSPGQSTDACVRNGLSWLWTGVIERIDKLREQHRLERIFVTGGDAEALLQLGLQAQWRPSLVLDGLECVARAGMRS
ncbi:MULTISPECIES: type III pantothenate kinase [Marinobacter]|uniref:type III pantothenate kinase n=1 Tax=Marinobacter TaxID=2742 RepID=UPI000DAE58E3|nr:MULTISPECIES: type III pantothenate kinase [Marinobacter]